MRSADLLMKRYYALLLLWASLVGLTVISCGGESGLKINSELITIRAVTVANEVEMIDGGATASTTGRFRMYDKEGLNNLLFITMQIYNPTQDTITFNANIPYLPLDKEKTKAAACGKTKAGISHDQRNWKVIPYLITISIAPGETEPFQMIYWFPVNETEAIWVLPGHSEINLHEWLYGRR
jgi:hypothetical protein